MDEFILSGDVVLNDEIVINGDIEMSGSTGTIGFKDITGNVLDNAQLKEALNSKYDELNIPRLTASDIAEIMSK